MYEIPVDEPTPAFARMWHAAGTHLQRRCGKRNWLKADLSPPFLEHLSFRLGNQLFFVRLEDVDRAVLCPGRRSGLLRVADGCAGHACLLPMRHERAGWEAVLPGWGLRDARTGESVDPPALITDEHIEMTDWELHDFAVQVVRDWLRKGGRQVVSSQGNPEVDPSIWFVGDDGPEWVMVRAARYPCMEVAPPASWKAIAQHCRRASTRGSFASVAAASAEDPFDPARGPTPLWRGHAMYVNFCGLVPFESMGSA